MSPLLPVVLALAAAPGAAPAAGGPPVPTVAVPLGPPAPAPRPRPAPEPLVVPPLSASVPGAAAAAAPPARPDAAPAATPAAPAPRDGAPMPWSTGAAGSGAGGLPPAGALVVAGALLAAALAWSRRLARRGRGGFARAGRRVRGQGWLAAFWPRPAVAGERIDILARSYVGARESLSIVQVGEERFLVGITGASVSLLARLEAGAPGPRLGVALATSPAVAGLPAAGPVQGVPPGPAARDFAEVLRIAAGEMPPPAGRGGDEALAAPPRPAEEAVRLALARARARLTTASPAPRPGEPA